MTSTSFIPRFWFPYLPTCPVNNAGSIDSREPYLYCLNHQRIYLLLGLHYAIRTGFQSNKILLVVLHDPHSSAYCQTGCLGSHEQFIYSSYVHRFQAGRDRLSMSAWPGATESVRRHLVCCRLQSSVWSSSWVVVAASDPTYSAFHRR